MADNVLLNSGTGGETCATDDVAGVQYQRVKLTDGAADSATPIAAGGGVEAGALRVTIASDSTGVVSVDDNGASLTVDGTVAISGTVPVTDNGGSLTVDGTVAATQSGAWNVTNVSGTVSLPTGAATAAKQPALGTAGTASADVISVQGIASMTPVQVSDAGGSLTVDNGGTFAVQVSSIAAGDNNIGNVDVLTVPTDPFGANADAASATGSISAKLRFIAATGIPITGTVTVGSHAVTNAGTFVTQENGAALTALQVIDNPVLVDDAAFTPATTSVHMGGFFADEASTDSVDEGDAGAARMTLDRKQIMATYVHAAAGGATPYKNLDCDETEDEIKGTAGKLYWVHAINLANAKRYLKFYNATAANVTVGTTTPVLTFPIPTMGDTNGAGFTINFGDMGVQFDTALTVAATTGFADNDTGAPGANEIILNAGYA
jgi:hypothetical protein